MDREKVSIMLFTTPDVGPTEEVVIAQIDDLRKTMRLYLHEPKRWAGSLRRTQFARAVQGSNSIEGFDASLDDALAIELGEDPLDASEETALAIKGYRDAMTYVLQIAEESDGQHGFHYGEQLIKSLHFMMTNYALINRPGRWRAGSIYVRNESTGQVVYEGPDLDLVPHLMRELVNQLNADNETPVMVRAAMAHLNLVMIHPFKDGNGRMGRCLQTLVLAQEKILSPVFCSIEEYLGRNTLSYYTSLAQAGGGSWQPQRDARPWVRYILTAHLRQARTTLRRIKESEAIWIQLEQLTAQRRLPERTIEALYSAIYGLRVRNSVYRAAFDDTEEEITEQVASRDLRSLAQVGLLIPHGQKRGRFYTAGKELLQMRSALYEARPPRDDTDPFAEMAGVPAAEELSSPN
jgi:Fic family protein